MANEPSKNTHISPIRTASGPIKLDHATAQIGGDVRGAEREDWLRVVTAARVASWDAAGR